MRMTTRSPTFRAIATTRVEGKDIHPYEQALLSMAKFHGHPQSRYDLLQIELKY